MRHIFSFFIIIFVVVVICKRIGNVKSHVKRCQISKLTNQFVQRVNCNAVTVNVSRKNCSVMTNQTVKTNQMKMPAVSSLIWSIQMPWSNFVRFSDWFSFCSFPVCVCVNNSCRLGSKPCPRVRHQPMYDSRLFLLVRWNPNSRQHWTISSTTNDHIDIQRCR